MIIVIFFHLSGYRNFKNFYLLCVLKDLKNALTKLLGQHRGFNRFGETKSTQILNQFLNAEKKGR